MTDFRNPSLELSIEQSLRKREREILHTASLERCQEPKCGQRSHARGLCKRHYDRKRRAHAATERRAR